MKKRHTDNMWQVNEQRMRATATKTKTSNQIKQSNVLFASVNFLQMSYFSNVAVVVRHNIEMLWL